MVNIQKPMNLLLRGQKTMNNEQQTMNSFMQNEPNFQNSQINITIILTRDYEDFKPFRLGKNEPKTNPNEPNFLGLWQAQLK